MWQHGRPPGPRYLSGLGLREALVGPTYGNDLDKDGRLVLPQCPYFKGKVRLPVLLVDWEDFEPARNPSNENDTSGRVMPSYTPRSPEEFEGLLNGQECVAQYFYDVSGGKADLELDLFGWLHSDAPDSYLRRRADYIKYWDHYKEYKCDRNAVFLDALRDAIAFHGMKLHRYDADRNGVLDGAVLVYEGNGGLCSGGNLSWITGASGRVDPPAFYFNNARALVSLDDRYHSRFAEQDILYEYYNNIPEQGSHSSCRTWAHELGHLLLGYPDYYPTYFNLQTGSWALSAGGFSCDPMKPVHPAAFEKWLFGRWIEPAVIEGTGYYTLQANEIPDGTTYDKGVYLYKIGIDNDPKRFLTIENRWFDTSHPQLGYTDPNPNTGTRWASGCYVESGLLIMEFNLGVNYFSRTPPQLYRHAPSRPSKPPSERRYIPPGGNAFRPGDLFEKCYETQCIKIQPMETPGRETRFHVEFSPR